MKVRYVAPIGRLAVLSATMVAACGGNTPETKTAEVASRSSEDRDRAPEEQSPGTHCLDTTCFDCGDSYCLPGWYCDEKVPGGPGCRWVPECGGESTCACVASALGSACACEERNGGVYVRCD